MVAYGGQSMSRRLRVVLVRRPDASFAVSNPRRWGYSASPDLKLAQKEHDAFVALVRETGTEVRYLDARQPGRADAIFLHDPAIYPRLIPVPFWKFLKKDGFEFVEVPDEEFHTMGPNVLAVAPRDCIMLEGNPVTQGRLEDAGCRVRTYRGREISLKAEGGATCLTRPILRAR